MKNKEILFVRYHCLFEWHPNLRQSKRIDCYDKYRKKQSRSSSKIVTIEEVYSWDKIAEQLFQLMQFGQTNKVMSETSLQSVFLNNLCFILEMIIYM